MLKEPRLKEIHRVYPTSIAVVLMLMINVLFHSCQSPESKTAATIILRPDNPINYHLADSCISLLKDGDLVMRGGADATSYMLRHMNQHNKNYSHCGLAFWENDSLVVYHSIGGEDNPNEELRRESVQRFFTPLNNERIGIARFKLSTMEIAQLHQEAIAQYQRKMMFDMDFDLQTDDRQYCSEFILKAVWKVKHDTAFIPFSATSTKTYVGIDNLFEHPNASLICDVKYK